MDQSHVRLRSCMQFGPVAEGANALGSDDAAAVALLAMPIGAAAVAAITAVDGLFGMKTDSSSYSSASSDAADDAARRSSSVSCIRRRRPAFHPPLTLLALRMRREERKERKKKSAGRGAREGKREGMHLESWVQRGEWAAQGCSHRVFFFLFARLMRQRVTAQQRERRAIERLLQ